MSRHLPLIVLAGVLLAGELAATLTALLPARPETRETPCRRPSCGCGCADDGRCVRCASEKKR